MSDNPVKVSVDDEEFCKARAMEQWARSLKRPDLTERDRVAGALDAYARHALALEALRQAAPAPVGSEPVAWRWIFDLEREEGLSWRFSETRPALTDFGEAHAILEPLYTSQALSDAHSAGMREGMDKAAQAMNAVEDDDEALADAIHAELKRQQAFSIERYGKIALAEGPIIRLVVEAIRSRAAAIRSLQPALDQPKDAPQNVILPPEFIVVLSLPAEEGR